MSLSHCTYALSISSLSFLGKIIGLSRSNAPSHMRGGLHICVHHEIHLSCKRKEQYSRSIKYNPLNDYSVYLFMLFYSHIFLCYFYVFYGRIKDIIITLNGISSGVFSAYKSPIDKILQISPTKKKRKKKNWYLIPSFNWK